ncbi:MAG: glycosyltransferase family 4 protein [Planctomycetaceae bacterium]|jgi:N,N'-diacetylbacillosaminyl-diphospho-undecaprenol alpha-1,3-N-acetylgalactosaminyltransferase|nr:glycosyltransferase family 4 protein [Planctomycetaceae bacterium]
MKITLIDNNDRSLLNFRGDLVRTLVQLGHSVSVITPAGGFVKDIEFLGAQHYAVPLARRSLNPFSDWFYYCRIRKILKTIRPGIVETMTVKPNIWGVLAAKSAGVPRIVSLVAGAGEVFNDGTGLKQQLVRSAVSFFYRFAGKYVGKYWFLNSENRDLFVKLKICRPEQAVVIISEGVNLQQFSPDSVSAEQTQKIRREFGADTDSVVIGCYPGRNLRSKGGLIFYEAAKIAERWNKNVRFVLAGSYDPQEKDSIPDDFVQTAAIFKHFPARPDIVEMLAATDILVFPSYYPEGVPRILLEGLAMHKPLITTGSVGCRETVDNGVNGFLVPPKNPQALADAVRKLVDDKDLRQRFGKAGYAKAVNQFDVHKINERVIREFLDIPAV